MIHLPALRGGPYQIGPVLGSGGAASVHLGFDLGKASRIPVAIKRLSSEVARDRHYLAMLTREAHILSSLVHPNIARVIDFGSQGGEPLLVMEYVEGVSCGQLMNHLDARGGGFPLPITLGIADAVLAALDHVHRAVDQQGRPLGIVHRDVAPGNVLLGSLGDIKLSDFGIARCGDETLNMDPQRVIGKVGYMSPEQASGEAIDHRSDIFSFAVMLSEMVLMCRFFPQSTPRDVLRAVQSADLSTLDRARDRLSLELRLVLATALARDPAERFQSAGELRVALGDYARHEGVIPAGSVALAAWLSELDLWPSKSGFRKRVDTSECGTMSPATIPPRRA